VLETSKKLGGVFTYEIIGGKRITFVTDPATYRIVFFARDSKDVKLDSAKIAYHWFGIPKQIAHDYTRPGLDTTRQAMAYGKVKAANDKVGTYILNTFKEWPIKGTRDLWDVAMLTFIPVVQHLFGEDTFAASACPHLAETLWAYDEDFKKVANGMPRKFFPEMEERAQELASVFETSIEKGNHLSDQCPVMKARLSVMDDPDNKKISPKDKGRFMFSVFWASQGNTIPGTFWMLLLILSHPRVKARLTEEVRSDKAFMKTTTNFGTEHLPYLQACVKETLRLKVANITLRDVVNSVEVEDSNGKKFIIPKGDEVTVASYVQHFDDRVYENPHEFRPERWLEKDFSDYEWFPFGAGTNKCSGRHLAQMELATVAALFVRTFDCDIIDPVPEEDWENTVAMVAPAKRSCRFTYKKL